MKKQPNTGRQTDYHRRPSNDEFREASSTTFSRSAGRIPPQDTEAEKSVLGACLVDSKYAVPVAVEILQPEHFYSQRNEMVFSAILGIFRAGGNSDVITVREELRRMGRLEDSGGSAYLSELVTSVVSSANVEAHCQIVAEKFLLRQLISVMGMRIQQCFDDREDAIGLVRASVDEIYDLTFRRWQSSDKHITQSFRELEEVLGAHSYQEQHAIGYSTPIQELNDRIGGLQNGSYHIITGEKSAGKTALANVLARHFAKNHGLVDYVSLEMPGYLVALRLAAQEADIQPVDAIKGTLVDTEYARLQEAKSVLSRLPLRINDSMGMTWTNIVASAKKLKVTEDLKLLIIDYLQLVQNPEDNHTKEAEMSSISRGLKILAKELGIPLIAISALSRAGEARYSGMIEYDADIWIHMENPRSHGKTQFEDTTDGRGKVRAHVRKARTGLDGGHFDLIMKPSTDIIPLPPRYSPQVTEDKDELPF